ncbi:dihydrolipoyllysine-residue acetyltransferase [Aquimonas sp.]|jgi:pyruvate dehydrogenase E2 component (dihydrolipoamide acetyltransferase)|uniref:dihydrolipoyllysine-residue acetyltransferase n=1 Tax=Aquimonas sp. TaxID=1872588 RepID=UPI0037BF6F9C
MATVVEARVPDIGSHSGVPVIELLVSVGDRVKKDQGLVTLESDKATMEVPCSEAGVVKELKVKLGDSLSEGMVVALIEVDAAGAAAPAPAATPAKVEAPARVEAVAATPTAAAAKVEAPAKSETPPPAAAEPTRTPPVSFSAASVLPQNVPHASPAVRLYARELGVDLAKVSGQGRKGRITREDVNAFVKQALARPAVAATAGAGGGLNLLPWPKVDFAKFGAVEAQPLSRIKKISGANLARNWAMIPHVTQFEQADITEMEAFRKRMGEENPNQKVTPLVFMIKAAVAALKAFPSFNASLDETAENLIYKKYFHIGIAVDTPDGLVVPVIRDADSKGLLQLAAELGEISKKARDKKLGPADMSGGCFSISSLGGIGGTSFTPIINAPEVAILGVSKSSLQPVWNGKEFEPRLMLPLSLSYDHRVIDGAEAARFASFFAKQLGDIRRLLL